MKKKKKKQAKGKRESGWWRQEGRQRRLRGGGWLVWGRRRGREKKRHSTNISDLKNFEFKYLNLQSIFRSQISRFFIMKGFNLRPIFQS